uniref:non-specific serine/threonine protein kinase n=1 Tax=Quercus lobata TaxID=97700 RepID=A0A7N2LI47_QUELO
MILTYERKPVDRSKAFRGNLWFQCTYGPSISAISAINNNPILVPNTTTEFIPSPRSSNGNLIGLIVGISIGVGGILFVFIVFYIIRERKRLQTNGDEELLGIDVRPFTFSYAELKTATEEFNPANKLGEGGFGPVYKGTLIDGRVVAVKQLSTASHQGKNQFVTEIAIISAVQHHNLVKLYGCCVEANKRLLVYEYLENKSLDQALFARGLAYLHEESRLQIVHRDVKAGNILLDSDLIPKISDFGLAKLYDDNKSHKHWPCRDHYAMRGHLTEKTDVFAFGIVALEIVSGKRNSDSSLEEEKMYLLEWAWQLHENNREVDLVDARLSEFNKEDVKQVIGVSFLCTQSSPTLRPSMSRVVAMLLGDIAVSISKHKEDSSVTRPILLDDLESEEEPEPLSIYRPTAEEISTSMGVPMEGFFDGAEAVLAMPAPSTAHKTPAKTPTPSAEQVPREGTHVEGVGETTPLPAERPSPSEGAIPPTAVQAKTTSPILPLVISTSDPFAAISQAAKGGASFVVTPSSIPGSATQTSVGPDIAAGVGMTALAAPVSPIPAAPSVPVSAVPTTPVSSVPAIPVSATPFEADRSSATVPDDAASFFVRFDEPEVNDLGPADFWVSGPPYVDFYSFKVPEDCVSHLVMLYSRHGNFMREFRLGRSSREHFLQMLGCVLNDIEHNFIDSISARKILQWRVVTQELISVGFAVEFILEHLREIARALFIRRVQPAVEAIDARIELLKKEVADLDGHRERLLSDVGGPSRFGDQSLITGLH